MTVIFSKKCEYGLQGVLYLAAHLEEKVTPSEDISKALGIPKEFISKILQSLTESGIVESKKGKNGGFTLAKAPSKIRLIDVVAAIDGVDIFNNCVLGFPKCSPDHPCPVHQEWGDLRTKAYSMLAEETIDKFRDRTLNKVKAL
jgi:Rrf2 family iron-sulfur cluster assembly transcriptional regulator